MCYDRTIGLILSFVRVKRTKHRAFCAVRRFRVIDAVNEKGKAKNVGEQNELLRLSCERLSHSGQFEPNPPV